VEGDATLTSEPMIFDYSFFDDSLRKLRRLRSYTYPYYILRGAVEVGSPRQLEIAPKVISMDVSEVSETAVFDTTSYSKEPGSNLRQLLDFLGNELPPDFLAFYKKYAEALVVTRSYPIHLWSEGKMIEEATTRWRLWNLQKPIRFFRFGEYFDCEAQQFGLWQEKVGSGIWRVVVTDIDSRDEEFDADEMDPVYIMGLSFYDWLKDLIDRDGLPDPFIEVSEKGGFLDPA
jgi:hypothetical protein